MYKAIKFTSLNLRVCLHIEILNEKRNNADTTNENRKNEEYEEYESINR